MTRNLIIAAVALLVLVLALTVLRKRWWRNRVVAKWGGSNPYLRTQGDAYWGTYSLGGLIGLYYNGLESWQPPGPAPSEEGEFSGQF
ncbi:MAG: hypothetical protein QY325_04390 [Flavobacteriales bacterium]|nr:MAG: hypothetical protein QY325_04390 [Flavobacteriales bacterium]